MPPPTPMIFPPPAAARRAADLSVRLSDSSASAGARVGAVLARVAREAWDEPTAGVVWWRAVDWHAVAMACGRRYGWGSGRVRRLSPDELVGVLEDLLGPDGGR